MEVAFVTGSRAEWRLIQPLLAAARADERLIPRLLVTGAHLSPRHGETIQTIRAAGFAPDACVSILEDTDSPDAIARAAGRAVLGLSDALARLDPAWTVVVGDRYESFAAGVAATMLGIPLAHVAGGETDVATNQDCNLRNALTKLAQLHFVAHELAASRVRALGEEPWRIHTVGLPSLDDVRTAAADFDTLRRTLPLPADCIARNMPCEPAKRRFILVSFLPVTLEADAARAQLDLLLAALDTQPHAHKLFVLSNADAGGDTLDARIRAWAVARSDVTLAAALPPDVYLAALRDAACYIGNSSSGVIEAPAFGTPAIIVGTRQDGRPTAASTHVARTPTRDSLARLLAEQMSRGTYMGIHSPYGDGRAAARICAALAAARIDPRLMTKRLIVPQQIEVSTMEPAAGGNGRSGRTNRAERPRQSGSARRRDPLSPPAEAPR